MYLLVMLYNAPKTHENAPKTRPRVYMIVVSDFFCEVG